MKGNTSKIFRLSVCQCHIINKRSFGSFMILSFMCLDLVITSVSGYSVCCVFGILDKIS